PGVEAAVETALGVVAPKVGDIGKTSTAARSDDQVSPLGGFVHVHPLAWPAGRHGSAPMVALSYASDGPLRGGVAVGWSLDIPAIHGDTSFGTVSESKRDVRPDRFQSTFLGGGSLIRDSDSPVNGAVPGTRGATGSEVYLALHDGRYV